MIRDVIRPERPDQSISLDGLDYIDVPAMGRRDYKLNFYAFKDQCSVVAKVLIVYNLVGQSYLLQ